LRYTLPSLSADLQTLALLMALCWVATKFVEKPGIALGRIVCRKLARGR
jgi:peptidoglycan/LPS O-acetylase OafA/YrhL